MPRRNDTVDKALNVCHACKLRKKTCDKVLPTCGFCSARNLPCRYDTGAKCTRRYHPGRQFVAIPTDPTTVPRQQRVDPIDKLITRFDISIESVRKVYLRQSQQWPLVISPAYLDLLEQQSFEGSRQVGVHLLMLSMWLLAETASQESKKEHPKLSDQTYIHRQLKTMFTQAQSGSPVSITLLQAGLLLAEYEYACLRPHLAYMTLGTCISISRVLGICYQPAHGELEMKASENEVEREQVRMAWVIPMIERIVMAELDLDPSASAMTGMPSRDRLSTVEARGHTTSEDPENTVKVLQGLSPQLEAIFLLSDVLDAFNYAKQGQGVLLSIYDDLDDRARRLLTSLMATEKAGQVSAPVSLCIRALFILHKKTLRSLRHPSIPTVEDALKRTSAGLDTLCEMVTEVCRQLAPSFPGSRPICCYYNLADALAHLKSKAAKNASHELLGDIDVLSASAEVCRRQWCLETIGEGD